MDIYSRYRSPFGYRNGDHNIDSYGVDHSGFSTRDELEYQLARQKREQELAQHYKDRGITENYPQFGTNFWGNPENNYGFGISGISQNIAKIMSDLYNTAYDTGERGYYYLQKKDLNSNKYDNLSSFGQAHTEAVRLTPIAIPDDNKHQYVSCVGAFDGPVTAIAIGLAGALKEGKDLYHKWNDPKYGTNLQIIQDSLKDLKNNALGIYKGLSSSDINQCNTLLPISARKKFF